MIEIKLIWHKWTDEKPDTLDDILVARTRERSKNETN